MTKTLHVGLRVGDLDRSLSFYTALGYEVQGGVPETEIGRLTMLKLPGDDFVSLELVHDPAGGAVRPAGISHLVVQVASVHDAVEGLAAAGIEATPPTSPDGREGFWTALVDDPDGYRIELVQWPAGHPAGMTRDDLVGPGRAEEPATLTAKEVVAELYRRQAAGDEHYLDDLVATDFVNHASGPQGREGLRWILRTIEHDLGPMTAEQHLLFGEGDLVAQHLTLHGTHHASTMPLLDGIPVEGRSVAWTFIHLWRVAGGQIVEHWACRDDHGLLVQLQRPAR